MIYQEVRIDVKCALVNDSVDINLSWDCFWHSNMLETCLVVVLSVPHFCGFSTQICASSEQRDRSVTIRLLQFVIVGCDVLK